MNIIKIEHDYPTYKMLEEYPNRYSKEFFDKYNELIKIPNYINNYTKLLSGINPNTNKKIKINGPTYNNIINKYIIYGYLFNNQYKSIIFTELNDINQLEYINETNKIKNEIDKNNIHIIEYNNNVKNIILQIDNLKKWDDYIIFNNKYYGTNKIIIDNIHIKNNCNGKIIETNKTLTECSQCDHGMWSCGRDCKEIYYKYLCEKCGWI